MRRRPDSCITVITGIVLTLAIPAQAAVTVEILHGSATVDRLGAESALNPGDPLLERDVITVATGGALRLRFGVGDAVELASDTAIALERLPDPTHPAESKTILSLDHGLMRVIRPGGDDLVLPFYLFLGDQRANISEGDFYFERAPRFVEACAETGQLSLPPTEFLPLRLVSAQNCYHNAGGDGPPRILQRDESYFSQVQARIGALNAVVATTVPAAASTPVPVSATPASVFARSTVSTATSASAIDPAVPVSGEATAPGAAAETVANSWAANLASFSQSEQANEEVQRLQAAGYSAAVDLREVGGITRYRVQLRGFTSADAARSTASEVAAHFGYKEYFLIKTP